MQFYKLAQELDTEIKRREARLDAREQKLDERASVLLATEASLDKRTAEMNARDRSQDLREEKISHQEITLNRLAEADKNNQDSAARLKTVEEKLKKAQELNDDATQKLEEMLKREVALSEREKTYKEKIELDVMKRFAFGK